ncbi:hypothetical protein Tco_0691898 [Tanacetum coccineum]
MAEQQTIKYAPQWTNMTVDNVIFQTNNVNFLRGFWEFWSTVVAFDLFPSTNEHEKCPLKEFLIKFSVLNGQRSLTLNFHTFCSSTGLNFNNDKYVDHPTPEVLGRNYSSIKQVNSIQQLLAYSLITGTEVDVGEIIYSDLVTKLLNKSRLKYVSYPRFISCALQVLLGSEYTQDKKFRFLPPIMSNSNFTKDPSKVTNIELTAHMIAVNNQRDSVSSPPLAVKPKKGKSQTVASTLPKSQGPEASGALSKKSKKPKSKRPPTKTKESPPKPTEGSEQSHSVSLGTVLDPQDLERNIQLASTGLPSTPNEGTRKSQPLPEGTITHSKDSGGNKQPLDRDITSMTSNEGTAKTKPHPEGSLGDKDSKGNIPPADMELIHTPVVDPLGTGAKYQDESKNESDEEEVLAAGDDMHEDPQDDAKVKNPSTNQAQPEPSNVQESASDSSSPDLKRFDNTLPLTERQLIKYLRKASIDQYYDENIAHRDQTDRLVGSLHEFPRQKQHYYQISSNITEVLSLVKGFDFSALLSNVKDLQAHALKQKEVSAAWTKSSTNMAWNLGSRMTIIEISQTALKSEVSSLWQDTSEIKSMMVEIYQAFKGQPSSASSGSVTLTLALTYIPANVEGENATNTATE